MRRVRVTIFCSGKAVNTFWVCVCSLSYPACNAHAPCCLLWTVRLYSILPHYLINGIIFGEKKHYWTRNVCFDFLYIVCLKHIQRRNERYVIISVHMSSCNVPVILLRFKSILNFLDKFSKNTEIASSWKSVEWEPSCWARTGGRTSVHDEVSCRCRDIAERPETCLKVVCAVEMAISQFEG
jgi:hypothetical protein